MSKSLFIVALQRVRNDVALGDVAAEGEVQRDGLMCCSPQALADDGESSWIMGSAGEHFSYRVGEGCFAVQVQQLPGARSEAANVAARLQPAREERVDAGHGGAQPVLPLCVAGAALLLEEGLAMGHLLLPRSLDGGDRPGNGPTG